MHHLEPMIFNNMTLQCAVKEMKEQAESVGVLCKGSHIQVEHLILVGYLMVYDYIKNR